MDGVYLGEFKNKEDVEKQFSVSLSDNDEIIFAEYTNEDYSGSAWVIFKRDEDFFEVHGSHCSCYGLEEQWDEERTSIAAILLRVQNGGHGSYHVDVLEHIINNYELRKTLNDELPNKQNSLRNKL